MTVLIAAKRPTRLRWWPEITGVLFGAAFAAALLVGFADRDHFSQVLAAAGLVYLGAAALGRPGMAWPLFGVTFVLVGVGFAVPAFDPLWPLLVLAAVLTIVGVATGRWRPSWGLPLQLLAMGAIVVLVLFAGAIAAPLAGILVGAGLLAHAGWDIRHIRSGRVVATTMAQFCAALDVVLAVTIIVATAIGSTK
ncbi:hypothetical protein ACIA5D_50780 [Actinoplanes sp. NPDC051513]|uniref:hypothetical protein n=1 Tax=Actinoplanes sp. NPDC051513 TaxID=3363908 RepID=UPI0037AC3633